MLGTISDIVFGIITSIYALYLLIGIYKDLRIRRYSPNIIAVVAIAAAVLIGESPAAAVAALAVFIREKLMRVVTEKARKTLDRSLLQLPDSVHLLRGRKSIDTEIKEIRPGQKILVRANETVPVDGTTATGEKIFSGLVTGKELVLRVTANAHDSHYQRIARMAAHASRGTTPFMRQSERYVLPFMLLSTAAAGALWLVTDDPRRFLAVLLVATPSPLILGPMLATLRGVATSVSGGIYVRSISIFERLAQARTILYGKDLKGTLSDKIMAVETSRPKPVLFASAAPDDSPVLTAADIGLSLGGIHIDNADVMTQDNHLSVVPRAIQTAKQTLQTAQLTVMVGMICCVLLQMLVILKHYNLALVALLQLLTDVIAIAITRRAEKSSR